MGNIICVFIIHSSLILYISQCAMFNDFMLILIILTFWLTFKNIWMASQHLKFHSIELMLTDKFKMENYYKQIATLAYRSSYINRFQSNYIYYYYCIKYYTLNIELCCCTFSVTKDIIYCTWDLSYWITLKSKNRIHNHFTYVHVKRKTQDARRKTQLNYSINFDMRHETQFKFIIYSLLNIVFFSIIYYFRGLFHQHTYTHNKITSKLLIDIEWTN